MTGNDSIELVALDADDTLWHNEPMYTSARERFCALLTRYEPAGIPDERLHQVEMRNLQHFGYGVKGFVLSMIESADVRTIMGLGRDMLAAPVTLLDGVREAVEELSACFRLILVTKGDLLHQETKLAGSGLGDRFTGIEIVSEKNAEVYRRVMRRYGVQPARFVMVGNSLRSDILPVLEAGAHAVYIPYEGTWIHEHVAEEHLRDATYHEIPAIRELPALLRRSLLTRSG
jgi:putative hydrolase of the HAD superfamily